MKMRRCCQCHHQGRSDACFKCGHPICSSCGTPIRLTKKNYQAARAIEQAESEKHIKSIMDHLSKTVK